MRDDPALSPGYGDDTDDPFFRPKPDGEADPAGEAGWFLQRERERRGESLDEAGEATGIHPHHIDAIEHGDMTRMPERFEALEMIGSYALYLGFDPEPLVGHYARILPRPPLAPKAGHPANPPPLSSAKIVKFGKRPSFAFRLKSIPGGAGGLVASLAGAIVLVTGVSFMAIRGGEVSITEPIALSPVSDPMPTASTDGETAEFTVSETAMPDDQVVTAAGDPPVDEAAGTNLDGLAALIEKDAAGQGPVAQSQPAQIATAAEGTSRLTLKAKAPVWVRIEDTSGNVVMTRMLMKGDTYKVPDRDGLVVIARDGGFIAYLIDGEEKGVLGTPGEILVGKPLDLKTLDGRS